MTGYHFSIGYNGATRCDYQSMWETLKRKTREICNSPDSIVKEARRVGCPEKCRKGCCQLEGYADGYGESYDSGVHPIQIDEKPGREQVIQMASTSCEIKYHVRRAFVRLLMEAMHRESIEINGTDILATLLLTH